LFSYRGINRWFYNNNFLAGLTTVTVLPLGDIAHQDWENDRAE
jgi:hypothetical protein